MTQLSKVIFDRLLRTMLKGPPQRKALPKALPAIT